MLSLSVIVKGVEFKTLDRFRCKVQWAEMLKDSVV